LLQALVELDDPGLPVAEINRRLGREAERLGLPRPSYERVRVILHDARRLQARRRRQTTLSVLVDVMFRVRPQEAILDHLAGIPLPKLRP